MSKTEKQIPKVSKMVDFNLNIIIFLTIFFVSLLNSILIIFYFDNYNCKFVNIKHIFFKKKFL